MTEGAWTRTSPILGRARLARSASPSDHGQRTLGYALLLPAFLLVFGLLIYPILYEAALSLTDAVNFEGPGRFVGAGNYLALAARPFFWQAARNTAGIVLATALVELVVGVLTALLLWWRFWGRSAIFLAVFMPWAFPAAFSAFAWYWLLTPPFHTFYTMNALAARFWLEGIFGMGAWQVLSIALMNVWRGSSIIAVFLLAGLNAIPEELLDYGRLEVASPWQYFWEVVLPLARRFVVLAVLVALVVTYSEFVTMYAETGGRITVAVLGTLAYTEAITTGNTGLGAAYALAQIPFAIALALLLLRTLDSWPPRRPGVHPDAGPHPPPLSTAGGEGSPDSPSPAKLERGRGGEAALRVRRRLLRTLGILAALGVMVFHLFPLYYTAVQAIRPISEDQFGNPFWVAHPSFASLGEVLGLDELRPVLTGVVAPTPANVFGALDDQDFWRWGWNTLVIFSAVLVVGLAVSFVAGYTLARFDLPGRVWLARLMFFSYFIPQIAVAVPMYQIFKPVNLDDSILGIVLLYLTLAIPFATWLFYSYFQGLATDVEEHASLDGGRAQIFLRIVLPMSWPVVIAAGLFAIGMMGSDVLYAGTFSLTNATKTLPAGFGVIAVDLDEWAPVNAAILLSSLPIIVGCAALSPYYVRGLRSALLEGA